MPLHELAPIVVSIGFLVYVIATTGGAIRVGWVTPAVLSGAFFLWSAAAIALEGPYGFWVLHSANLWGNQVWFDLLFAAAIGWTLILPRARAQGMSVWPWLLFVVTTGCIGLLAMVSRLLWLEGRAAKA
jgi:hypothetical protein